MVPFQCGQLRCLFLLASVDIKTKHLIRFNLYEEYRLSYRGQVNNTTKVFWQERVLKWVKHSLTFDKGRLLIFFLNAGNLEDDSSTKVQWMTCNIYMWCGDPLRRFEVTEIVGSTNVCCILCLRWKAFLFCLYWTLSVELIVHACSLFDSLSNVELFRMM